MSKYENRTYLFFGVAFTRNICYSVNIIHNQLSLQAQPPRLLSTVWRHDGTAFGQAAMDICTLARQTEGAVREWMGAKGNVIAEQSEHFYKALTTEREKYEKPL
ncbi:MAG: hypothetical protein HFH62_07710 [Lachnospiraceae bacterium]|nr:hypothetical protein [Lachnospiraceae bacterium]